MFLEHFKYASFIYSCLWNFTLYSPLNLKKNYKEVQFHHIQASGWVTGQSSSKVLTLFLWNSVVVLSAQPLLSDSVIQFTVMVSCRHWNIRSGAKQSFHQFMLPQSGLQACVLSALFFCHIQLAMGPTRTRTAHTPTLLRHAFSRHSWLWGAQLFPSSEVSCSVLF